MMDLMYRIPSDDTIQKVIITKEVIDKTGEPEIIQGEPSGKNRNQPYRGRGRKKGGPETA